MVLKTQGRPGQMLLLANRMGESELLLSAPSELISEAAHTMHSTFCLDSCRSPVN